MASPTVIKDDEIEVVKPLKSRSKGLLYVDVKVCGRSLRAMIHTGHNYLACSEAERLALPLDKSPWVESKLSILLPNR